jgi:hypothetical protein
MEASAEAEAIAAKHWTIRGVPSAEGGRTLKWKGGSAMNVLSMRIPHWKLLLAVLGPLLVTGLSRPPAVDLTRGLAEPAIRVSVPAPPAALTKSEKKLPFAVSDVVLFLRQNFRISPEESDRDYALFRYVDRQSDGTNEEILRIAVRTYSNHIWVAFTFREFSAMHYVAEFIEAPLFTRTESDRLYGLLYAERPRVWEKVGRFHVRGALLNVADGTEASFEFAPDRPFE